MQTKIYEPAYIKLVVNYLTRLADVSTSLKEMEVRHQEALRQLRTEQKRMKKLQSIQKQTAEELKSITAQKEHLLTENSKLRTALEQLKKLDLAIEKKRDRLR